MFRLCDRLLESVRLTLDKEEAGAKATARQEVDAMLRVCPLKLDDRILDLCCGKGYHAMDLAARGYRAIAGVDRPGCGVGTARRQARIEELAIPFTEFDVQRYLPTNVDYDVVFMHGNSLGHFIAEDEAAAVLKICHRALRPSGILALSLIDGDWLRQNFEPATTELVPGGGLIVRQRTFRDACLTTNVIVIGADDTVVSNRVSSERIYTRSQIEATLRAAGFRDVVFSDPMMTVSDSENGGAPSTRLRLVAARAVPNSVASDIRTMHRTDTGAA